MCRYVQKTKNFVKVMVGFQYHFNRLRGVEQIVDEKKGNIFPSIRTD